MGAVRRRGGRSWLLDYREPSGRRRRETIRAASRAEADRALKQREGDLAHGRPLFARADRVRFEDLARDLLRDYALNGRRSAGKARKSVERLTQHFGGWRAVNIHEADVRAYV